MAEQPSFFTYEQLDAFYFEMIPEEKVEFTYDLDKSEIAEITPASFETVTEQVIKKEGYFTYRIIPAQFETKTKQIVTSIINVCQETEAITKTEELFSKSAYTKLVVHPAKFGTVTYKIQKSDAEYSYEVNEDRHDLALSLVSLPNSIEYKTPESIESSLLTEHLGLNEVVSKDTIISDCYSCSKKFNRFGKYCMEDSNPLYTTYTYNRLLEPAWIERVQVAERNDTVTISTVPNVDEISKDCLKYTYRTFSSNHLAREASYESAYFEPEYSTLSERKLVVPPVREVTTDRTPAKMEEIITQTAGYRKQGPVKLNCVSPLTEIHKKKIYKKLLSLGYGTGLFDDATFLKAVIDYQIDNNLKIGVINFELIEHLVLR